jgi:hypothetical protein
MGSDPKSCAICDRPPHEVKMRNSGAFYGLVIECPQCGTYELVGPEAIARSFRCPAEIKKPLSCAARQAFEDGHPLRIEGANAEEFARPHTRTRVSENRERLLRVAAGRAGRPGGTAKFSPETDFTLIDCYSRDEFFWYIRWLEQQGLLSREGSGFGVSLTMDGWERAQPLPRVGGLPGRCFVAMWFADETRAAYEGGIEPAISDAGFVAVRIDRKEHNNEIPDEIISEIRNCEFMVADFTGQRSGVYYEAGFAMGLGRKVIWSCRKNEIEKLHFDTNHKNHIDWQTPEELHKRLYDRIRATILEQA